MREARAFGLPSLLLSVVIVSHYGYDLIASFYPDAQQLAAARAWAYVLRGFETAILYTAVLALAPPAARSAFAVACGWGFFESAQVIACRMQYPMDRAPLPTGLYSGLCDKVTGLPVYMLTVFVVLLVLSLRKSTDGHAS
jgi:hypothetical protein